MEATSLGLAGLAPGPAWTLGGEQGSSGSGMQTLYEKFQDPDCRYSIRPFWF
jgi:hypothetical protein